MRHHDATIAFDSPYLKSFVDLNNARWLLIHILLIVRNMIVMNNNISMAPELEEVPHSCGEIGVVSTGGLQKEGKV